VSFGSFNLSKINLRKEGEEEGEKERQRYEGEYEGEYDIEYVEEIIERNVEEMEQHEGGRVGYEEEDEEDEEEYYDEEDRNEYYYDGDYYDGDYYDENYYDENYYDENYYDDYENEEEKKEKNIENRYKLECENIVNSVGILTREEIIKNMKNFLVMNNNSGKKNIKIMIMGYMFRFLIREDAGNELFKNRNFTNTVWSKMKEHYHIQELKTDILNLYLTHYSNFDFDELISS
jgi:hypothetical protein